MLWLELWMQGMGGRVTASVLSSFLAHFPANVWLSLHLATCTLFNSCLPASGNTLTMAEAPPQSHWLIHADSRNRDIVLIFIKMIPNTVIRYSLILWSNWSASITNELGCLPKSFMYLFPYQVCSWFQISYSRMSLALLSGYGTDSEDETDEDKEKNSKGTVSVQPVQVQQ